MTDRSMMSAIAAPHRTLEQQQSALTKANGVRYARRMMRQRVQDAGHDGASILASMLDGDRTLFGNLFVFQAAMWVKGVHDDHVRQLLRATGIDPWCKVRRMTERQRTALTGELRAFAAGESCAVRLRPAKRKDPRVCRECGERMRTRTTKGICGFCELAGQA